jgi:hypothetical protein
MQATMTNDERSAAEVATFIAETPERYFAYCVYRRMEPGVPHKIRRGDKITTWTGDELATVTSAGDEWMSNFGDIRQAFRCKAINGATYSGVAFPRTGDYVRLRKVSA